MPDSITITLTLPDPILSPNARAHWAKLAMAKAKFRALSRHLTIREMRQHEMIGSFCSRMPEANWQRASEHTTFYFAQNRRRDKDNFSAMLKSARDGIVDAGLLADDSGLVQHPVTFAIDRENPRVEIEIRKGEG